MAVTQIPLTLLDTAIYCCIVYFMVDYYRSAEAFFTFLAILVATSLAMSCVVRLLAILSPNQTMASANSALLIISLVISSGFVIVRGGLLLPLLLLALSNAAWHLLPHPLSDMFRTLAAMKTQACWLYTG
jgi:hypothetical protein